VFHALSTVSGLQEGRTEARDTDDVQPVELAHVWAVLPHLRPTVAAMVEVQLLTGMRPGEVCRLRPADIDQSNPVWLFRPVQFKTPPPR
jgi:integrase